MKKILVMAVVAGLLFGAMFSSDVIAENKLGLEEWDRFAEICDGVFDGAGYKVLSHEGYDITSTFVENNRKRYDQRNYYQLWKTMQEEKYGITWGNVSTQMEEQQGTRANMVLHINQYFYWVRSQYLFFPNHSFEALVCLSVDLTVSDGYTILGYANPRIQSLYFNTGAYFETYFITNYLTTSMSSNHQTFSMESEYYYCVYIYANWFELLDDPMADPILGDSEDTQTLYSKFTVDYNGTVVFRTPDDTP